MNFLKKKIKTVVHGGKRNKDDDDDDFDNYIPEVPPHPSTLNSETPNGAAAAAFASPSNFTTNFANFNQQTSNFNPSSDQRLFRLFLITSATPSSSSLTRRSAR